MIILNKITEDRFTILENGHYVGDVRFRGIHRDAFPTVPAVGGNKWRATIYFEVDSVLWYVDVLDDLPQTAAETAAKRRALM